MDQYSREFIAEKARLRPEDLGRKADGPPCRIVVNRDS